MLLRFIDGTAKNNELRLYNVNQTHLILASGKLVLQKRSLRQYLVRLGQPLQRRVGVVAVSDASLVDDSRRLVVEERPTRVAFRAVVVGVARQHDALRVDANGADDAVARDALRSEAVDDERFQSRGQNLARIERVTV